MTPEQKIKRLEDIISWVQENAKCLETLRFVARALRNIADEADGACSCPQRWIRDQYAGRTLDRDCPLHGMQRDSGRRT